jgi:N-acetylglucosamine-6-phosphate deacetylase
VQEGARGAHDAEFIRKPDIAYLEKLIEWAGDNVKLLTITAEAEGAEQLARYAVSRGIAVSLGHQMAGEEDLKKLARAGAVALTHLGNGVPAVLPRHKNPIWAGLANDDLTAMIITDGHHLPASVLKTIIRTKGAECCVVTSDASPLAGLAPGRYETTSHKLVLEDSGRLWDEVTGYFAASSATMLQCMNHLASLNLVSSDELVTMGFYNPLKLIGLDADDVAPGRGIWFDEKRRVFHMRE